MKLIGAFKLVSLLIMVATLLAMSLFAGLMIATAGVALYPPLVKVTAPLACGGDFTIESQRFNPSPGESVVTHKFYCQEIDSGVKTDISTHAVLIVFGVYSTLIFIVSLVGAIGVIGVAYLAIGRYRGRLNQELPLR